MPILRFSKRGFICVTVFLIVRFATPAYGTNCSEPAIYAQSLPTDKRAPSAGLHVVSLNMAREERLDRILQDLRKAQSLAGADVWLLQEAAERPASVRTIADLASSLKLNYVFAPTDFLDGGKLASGLAVLSRYPILEPRIIPLTRHNLKFHTRCRIALEVQIAGPSGPVRFYNLHLDTRITLGQRIQQVMPVLEQAGALSGPVVVAGDFNTADVRWLWNILPIPYAENHRNRLRHAFRELGFSSPLDGSGPTINVLRLPLHLDWIFPRKLDWVSAGVTKIGFSDHNAVWVRFDTLDGQD